MARFVAIAASVLVGLAFGGCSVATPLAARSSTSEAQGPAPAHIGTWRVVRFHVWEPNGTVRMAFGEHPSGYLVFDPTGHAFVHLMRTPPVGPFASPSSPTADELRAAYAAYVSYYGPYRVDESTGSFTVQVEGSNRPDFTHTTQARRFQIRGDTLIVGIPNQYQATLVRVRATRP